MALETKQEHQDTPLWQEKMAITGVEAALEENQMELSQWLIQQAKLEEKDQNESLKMLKSLVKESGLSIEHVFSIHAEFKELSQSISQPQ